MTDFAKVQEIADKVAAIQKSNRISHTDGAHALKLVGELAQAILGGDQTTHPHPPLSEPRQLVEGGEGRRIGGFLWCLLLRSCSSGGRFAFSTREQ